MVVETNAQRIVELGTKAGNSTCAFVIGAAETGGRVVSVDHGRGAEYSGEPDTSADLVRTSELVRKKLGLGDFWTLVTRDDIEYAREYNDEIDIVFIDTVHSYDQTARELEVWGSKVVKGGLIIIHDTVSYPEQNKAIWEFLDKHLGSDYVEHLNCNGLGIIIKDSKQVKKARNDMTRPSRASAVMNERINRMQESLTAMRAMLRRTDDHIKARLQDSVRTLALSNETLTDPLAKLLLLYWARQDLQSVFPEVQDGDYMRLLGWAKEQAALMSDSSYEVLAHNRDWYLLDPWTKREHENLELRRDMENLSNEVRELRATAVKLEARLMAQKHAYQNAINLKASEYKSLLAEKSAEFNHALEQKERTIRAIKVDLEQAEAKLRFISSSMTWSLLAGWQRFERHLLPLGSRREATYLRFLDRLRKAFRT